MMALSLATMVSADDMLLNAAVVVVCTPVGCCGATSLLSFHFLKHLLANFIERIKRFLAGFCERCASALPAAVEDDADMAAVCM